MKKFNGTGNCIPSMHYMVDITEKITKITELVEYGEYFTINRARQYGKTTTLDLLEIRLTELGYTVAYLSFEGLSYNYFESPESFCQMFMKQMQDYLHDDLWFDKNVTDIKNIKYQMVNKGLVVLGENEGSHNSPWNIAVDFDVDMSFNPIEISTMLTDYEKDYNTGMDIGVISQEIYNYTGGYPFLVSRICQHIDVKLNKDWTINGVQEAVKIILKERNMLFDDLAKNMENNKDLYKFLKEILLTNNGEPLSYLIPEIQLGLMYGILDKSNGLNISNIIFKTVIANYIAQKERA